MPQKPPAGALPNSTSVKAAGTGALKWFRCAAAILAKEARVEWRSRLAVGSTLLFSLCALTAMAYTIGQTKLQPSVEAALLWVVLLFAAMSGLSRPFVREEEMATADNLRLYAPSSAVLAGKLLFNLAFMGLIELVTVPLFFVIMPADLSSTNYGLLVTISLLGGAGLAATSTFVAALISQASAAGARGALFFVVSFPALVPVLMAAVHGTYAALAPAATPPEFGQNSIVTLISYDIVVTAAAYLLFDWVWRES